MTAQNADRKEPKKKSQHFVPRFYLTNFSFDGGKRLHLVRVRNLQAISGIGLKDQCADDYFYGKDAVVENALQDIESETARVFRSIIAHQSLPTVDTPENFIFRSFVCMQWGRTKSRAENSEALFNKAIKTVFAPQWRAAGITQEQIDEVHIGSEYPGSYSLGMAAEMIPFLADLRGKLIVAGTLGEFVASDTPVVLVNPFYLGRYPGGVTGLSVRGLVILFPISPQLLAVLYDKDCYRVGSPDKLVVPLHQAGDLTALNNFQFLNADAAVYFRDEKLRPQHLAGFASVARMRTDDRNVVIEAASSTPGDNSSLLHTYHADAHYRPKLSFLTLLNKRRSEKGAVSQMELRNPDLNRLFDQYHEDKKAGRCRPGFVDYCARLGFARAGKTMPDSIPPEHQTEHVTS